MRAQSHRLLPLTRPLRFAYYYEKDLVGEMDLTVFEDERENMEPAPSSRLSALFKFSDKNHRLPERDGMFSNASPRLDELRAMHDKDVVGAITDLLSSVERKVAATKVQALRRGQNARRMVKDPEYLKRLEMAKAKGGAGAGAAGGEAGGGEAGETPRKMKSAADAM